MAGMQAGREWLVVLRQPLNPKLEYIITDYPPIRLRCSLGRQPIHFLKVLLKTKGF